MSIFKILEDLQLQKRPKNPYQLYYYLNKHPEKITTEINDKGFNCLTHTLSNYSSEVVEILLDTIQLLILSNKAPESVFETLDNKGNNVFSVVLRITNKDQRHSRLKMLIKIGVEPTIRDKNDDTPLHIACRYNDFFSVYLLTRNKFTTRVNTLGKNKVTPIYYSIINKNVELFDLLLELGAILEGTVEGKDINYIPLIYEQNDKRLEKTYEKFAKKQTKRQKQKIQREFKKKDIREKYKKLCQNLEKTDYNDLIKYARSINIGVYDDTLHLKPKEEICKSISQRVLIKEYFPNFSFSESYS